MGPETIEAFKKNFGELKIQHENITKDVKENAINEINLLLEDNKFREAKQGIDYLNQLLNEIEFKFNFETIQISLQQYSANFEDLKQNKYEEGFQRKEDVNEKQTKEVTSSQAFSPNNNPDAGVITETRFMDYLREKFLEHNFQFVNSNEENIELSKDKRHFYLTFDKDNYQKDDYFNILEKMNEKKNIGFICDTESSLIKVKEIANEWIQISPEHKTKYLTINFTSKSRLSSKTDDLFETIRNIN